MRGAQPSSTKQRWSGSYFLVVLIYAAYRGGLKSPGLLTGVLLLQAMGCQDFFVEYFRVPDSQFFLPQTPMGSPYSLVSIGATMGPTLSLPMMLIGLASLFAIHSSGERYKSGDNIRDISLFDLYRLNWMERAGLVGRIL